MAFQEVSVSEIRGSAAVVVGVVPGLPAPGLRTIGGHCGLDRKTVRRYVEAAQAAGLTREDGVEALDDGLIRGGRRGGAPGATAWSRRGVGTAAGVREADQRWVAGTEEQRPLTVTKIHTLLARQGCVVPYRTLHRFACERCGFGRKDTTVRVADGDPGIECQLDFGYLGCSPTPLMGAAARCTR